MSFLANKAGGFRAHEPSGFEISSTFLRQALKSSFQFQVENVFSLTLCIPRLANPGFSLGMLYQLKAGAAQDSFDRSPVGDKPVRRVVRITVLDEIEAG